ncbi:1-phosphofructokinase family hexose kinase [Kineococcus rubinsiae]|uniref:1-phosphofructokinase family hexose kinase n=1 Tax=Kineococcus rubinsiae TaxID=2609562 RepID=UPI00142F65F3|nr:hexose kinase [Kineococcus rubinsiae]NIZ91266.1 hexose kinase [Kineococcus rubinsiae]
MSAPTAPAGRVLTVTLNPAVDVTYAVDALTVGETVRVRGVRSRSGGKGVNVASVVRALGGEAVVVALTAAREPDEFEAGLDALHLPHRLVLALEAVRRTVAVVAADGTTTSLQEPGGPAAEGTAEAVTAVLVEELAQGADAVVISGSVPPGLPVDLPARLAELCRDAGVPVVADLSGAPLRAAAGVGAVLVPNRDELADLVGAPARDLREVLGAGRHLLAGGAAAVLATLGEQGVVAVTPEGAWHARPVEVVAGNPTGAGDAAAAALARHLGAGVAAWPAVLADVVATSAACVLRPVAGEVDTGARARWLDLVEVEELDEERGARR